MNTKSLSKPTKRSGAQDASLERRHNRDILMKTEARGFCLDGVEDKQADDNLQHYLA